MTLPIEEACICGGRNPNCFRCDGWGFVRKLGEAQAEEEAKRRGTYLARLNREKKIVGNYLVRLNREKQIDQLLDKWMNDYGEIVNASHRCPICKVSLIPKNLRKHFKKSHIKN